MKSAGGAPKPLMRKSEATDVLELKNFELDPALLAVMSDESQQIPQRIEAMCRYLGQVQENNTFHIDALNAIASAQALFKPANVEFGPNLCQLLHSLCALKDAVLVPVSEFVSPIRFMEGLSSMSGRILPPAAKAILDAAWHLITENVQFVRRNHADLYRVLIEKVESACSYGDKATVQSMAELKGLAIRARHTLVIQYGFAEKYDIVRDDLVRFFRDSLQNFESKNLSMDLFLAELKIVRMFLKLPPDVSECVRVEEMIKPLTFFSFQAPANVALSALKTLLAFSMSRDPVLVGMLIQTGFSQYSSSFTCPELDVRRWRRMYCSVWENIVKGIFPKNCNPMFETLLRKGQTALKEKVPEIVQALLPMLSQEADYSSTHGSAMVIIALINCGDRGIVEGCISHLDAANVDLVELIGHLMPHEGPCEIADMMHALMVAYDRAAARGTGSPFIESLCSESSLACLDESMSLIKDNVPPPIFTTLEQFMARIKASSS